MKYFISMISIACFINVCQSYGMESKEGKYSFSTPTLTDILQITVSETQELLQSKQYTDILEKIVGTARHHRQSHIQECAVMLVVLLKNHYGLIPKIWVSKKFDNKTLIKLILNHNNEMIAWGIFLLKRTSSETAKNVALQIMESAYSLLSTLKPSHPKTPINTSGSSNVAIVPVESTAVIQVTQNLEMIAHDDDEEDENQSCLCSCSWLCDILSHLMMG